MGEKESLSKAMTAREGTDWCVSGSLRGMELLGEGLTLLKVYSHTPHQGSRD